MRWVLPGGAILGESNREDNERTVACRPGAAVLVRTVPHKQPPLPPPLPPPPPQKPIEQLSTIQRPGPDAERTARMQRKGRQPRRQWLMSVKRLLEVLALLVGLIAAILALLSGLRK